MPEAEEMGQFGLDGDEYEKAQQALDSIVQTDEDLSKHITQTTQKYHEAVRSIEDNRSIIEKAKSDIVDAQATINKLKPYIEKWKRAFESGEEIVENKSHGKKRHWGSGKYPEVIELFERYRTGKIGSKTMIEEFNNEWALKYGPIKESNWNTLMQRIKEGRYKP